MVTEKRTPIIAPIKSVGMRGAMLAAMQSHASMIEGLRSKKTTAKGASAHD